MNPNDKKSAIFWDPDAQQLGISGSLPATPDSLRAAGYQFMSGDCETVENACVWLWCHLENKRWYLALVSKDFVVASALCFSSSTLAEVIRQFKIIGGVL